MLLHRTMFAVAALLATGLALAEDNKIRTIHFAKDDLNKVPQGWKVERTGKGEGSDWKVVEDKTVPSKTGLALAQVAASPSSMFNLCIVEDSKYQDVEIGVAFKAVKGDKDQGGGLVWRYQDADNYYIARMNPLESNFRVYKVVDGKRTQLETKEDLKVPAGEWHTISVKMIGDKIECSLDGKKYLEAKDDTFKKPGKIGLWTKADAQTHFDDLKVSGK